MLWDGTHVIVLGNGKAAIPEFLRIIPTILPEVIALSVVLFSQGRGVDGIVFQRFFQRGVNGNLKYSKAANLHNPEQFLHCTPIVGDMLEHMVADDDIERAVGEGDVLHVHLHLCPGRVEVGCGVVEVWHSAKALQEAVFGGNVKYPEAGGEEIGLLLQVKPYQPMPFQRHGVWCQRIGAWVDSPVGQELAVGTPGDGVFKPVAPVEDGHEPEKGPGYFL